MTVCDYCRNDSRETSPITIDMCTPDTRLEDYGMRLDLCLDCYKAIVWIITRGACTGERTAT